MLSNVGNTLRELKIIDYKLCRNDCTALVSLTCESKPRDNDAFATLLASCGGQLRRAVLDETFREKDISTVVSSCSNVELRVPSRE